MSSIGESEVPGHQLIKNLATGPNGSVYLAARDGTGWQVVVKTFRPAVLVDGEAERAERGRRVAAFLDAARMQQELAGATKTWAPVHDFGPLAEEEPGSPAGAYYTTDPYPASVEWLIKGHVAVGGGALRAIVGGVVEGLAEVRRCCGRGHGNLTPANIMMTRRDVRNVRVLLADPATDADPAADESDDRWALGALVYALVMHKPVRRMMLLPVTPSAEWDALGRRGGRWLDLCNRLLSRDAAARPEPAAVAAELSKLREANTGRIVRRAAAAAAVLMLGTGVGLGVYVHRYNGYVAAAKVTQAPWVASLAERYWKDPDLRADVENDSLLRVPLEKAMRPFDPNVKAVKGQGGWPVPSLADYRAARADAETARHDLDDLVKLFTPQRCAALRTLSEHRAKADANRWGNVVGTLDKYLADVPPTGEAEAGKRLATLFTRAAAIDGQFEGLARLWAPMDEAVKALPGTGAAGDHSPRAVGQALADYAADHTQLDGTDGTIANARQACWGIETLVRRDEKNLMSASEFDDQVRAVVTAVFSPDKVPDALDGDVAALAQQYVRLDTGADAEELRRLELKEQETFDAVAGGRAGLAGDREAVRGRVEGFAGQTYRLRDARDVEARVKAGKADLDRLTRRSEAAGTVFRWLATADHLDATADHPGWAAVAAVLNAQAVSMVDNPDLFARRQAWVLRWRDRLSAVKRAVADRTGRLAGYAGPADLRAEAGAALMAALPAIAIDADPPAVTSLMTAAARSDRAAAATTLIDFAADFPADGSPGRFDLVNWDRLADKWTNGTAPAANKAFWDARVAAPDGPLAAVPCVRRYAAYLTAANATRGKPRAALVAAIGPGPGDATAWLARLRLEEPARADVWPAEPAELLAARAWQTPSRGLGDKLGMTDADAATLLAARQQAAWVRFVVTAADAGGRWTPAELQAHAASPARVGELRRNFDVAHDLAPGFGLPTADARLAALAARARAPASPEASAGARDAAYDWLVYLGQRTDRSEFNRAAFTAAAEGLPPPITGKPISALAVVSPIASDADFYYYIGNPSWYCWPQREGEFRPGPTPKVVAVEKPPIVRTVSSPPPPPPPPPPADPPVPDPGGNTP